jgi:hypothetical protein
MIATFQRAAAQQAGVVDEEIRHAKYQQRGEPPLVESRISRPAFVSSI